MILIPDCVFPRITDTVPLVVLAITVVTIKKKPHIIQVFKIRPFNLMLNFLGSWKVMGICLDDSVIATQNVCNPDVCFENTRGSFTTQISKQKDEWKHCSIESPH